MAAAAAEAEDLATSWASSQAHFLEVENRATAINSLALTAAQAAQAATVHQEASEAFSGVCLVDLDPYVLP
jgi:hypothetical protein